MKKIFLGLLIFFTLLIGSIATVWTFPQLILTPDRVQSLVQKYLGDFFSTPPREITLRLDPYGFKGKRLIINADHFCLKEPEGCFEKVHVELAFKWVGLTRFKIEELGPIEILNQSLTIREPEEPSPPSPSSGKPWTNYILIPSNVKVSSLKVISPKIEILSKESSILGNVNLSGENIQSMQLLANAKSSDGLKAHLDAQTGYVGGKIVLNGNAQLTHVAPWLGMIELRSLKITHDQFLHLESEVNIAIEPKLSLAARDSALPKATYGNKIRGALTVEETIQNDESHFDYILKLGPNLQKGIHLNALLKGTFPFPEGEEYRFGLKDVFAEVKIPQFQTLVESLKRTSSAIPAPFSALNGSIVFQVGKEGKSIDEDSIPLLLHTNLQSPEQVIQTNSEGKISFKKGLKNISLVGKTDLSKITFTLPEVDPIAPPPALKRDSRIKSLVEIEKKEKKQIQKEKKARIRAETGSSFDLDWTVDSKPGAIRIYYSVCRPYVPVDVHLAIKDEGTTGKITVLPLDLHYLSRDAHVDYFQYRIGKNLNRIYEGKLVVQKTEYTIFINVFEKEGKPKVEFASNPPLEESDIISVLLFNQTSSELSPDESNSVADTQSAVANRALGLLSVWALSNTPIEAVNYNAASGVYAARVRIAAGLTATVGTDWEKTQEVALRKRIGKNFVLSTIFGQEGETEGRTTKTLLEWFRRF